MLNELMILSAKYLYLLIVFVGLIFIGLRLKTKNKDIVWFALLSLPLVFLIAKISGYFFYNPRPFVIFHFTPLINHIADNGFPSDHSLLSFAIASLIFVFNKKLGLILLMLGILIGFSRVYVGIHSPIDVIGSFVISIVITYLVYYFYLLKSPRINKK